jgi:alanyl-tRNA synthetase
VVTHKLYLEDSYLLEFEARVVARREHAGKPAVVLDRTAFYAESGGQPWDIGRLDGAQVEAVIESDGGEILHVLDRALETDAVSGRVDAARRRDHRQQHHGQHLLSRALADVAGAETVSFHLGSEACSVDLDREIGDDQAFAASRRANEIVWEARPVETRQMPREEAMRLGLDPSAHVGASVRVIDVRGFDQNPCGGTHPRNTAEVGVVVVLGLERYKGGSRVHFVCGDRALATLRVRNRILGESAAAASAPIAELPQAVRKLVERLSAADKRARELMDWALDGEARRLLAEAKETPPLVVAAYDGWAPGDLRTLAIKLTRRSPCVALLASRGEKAHVVFAQSEGLPHDLSALLRDALAGLDGRGGGKGNLVQGGGDRVAELDAVLSRAAAVIRARA